MKDSEILARIRQGDEGALDYLYKKNYKMMTKMVINNSGTEDEAKDIYQDALIVFWQKAVSGNLVLSSKISTFIYSICQNLWRKELERKSKLSSEEKDSPEINDVDRRERIEIINNSINNLGETCRKILTYYYFDNLSMSDIAEKMGFANADTAKTKKYKCKKELDELIKSKYKASDFLD
ncbi:sigma-70 family RNA polymerase sigma factor [Rhodocytophaga aerolata]|jgi:RNA polymerase sigma factor (sigma-70 family)|uniref:Sigma-70 family RNA polymerase sigma factor n=1 Tax=Rhodocytophaga aerolata TaxID=455078 RepID=A0ABT8RIC6_9BACT|nr:sigma-70 family RNA polymerase sigma factor [Rhodocytophaga aerolata]MDO1450923.1 sigma-70 family RNA polymerase sigma factor [Rhodocytophaga aerolata]